MNTSKWKVIKDEIRQLYITENNSLAATIDTIERRHGCRASTRKWKMMLKEWGFEKYVSAQDMQFVIEKALHRASEESKDTEFFHHGIRIPEQKIGNFRKRKIPIDFDTSSALPVTPDGITYGTPVDDPGLVVQSRFDRDTSQKPPDTPEESSGSILVSSSARAPPPELFARSGMESSPPDMIEQARKTECLAQFFKDAGHLQASEELLEQAISEYSEANGPHSYDAYRVRCDLVLLSPSTKHGEYFIKLMPLVMLGLEEMGNAALAAIRLAKTLGDILVSKGFFFEADRLYAKAIQLHTTLGLPNWQLQSYKLALAGIYIQTQQLDLAFPLLESTLAWHFREDSEKHQSTSAIVSELARWYSKYTTSTTVTQGQRKQTLKSSLGTIVLRITPMLFLHEVPDHHYLDILRLAHGFLGTEDSHLADLLFEYSLPGISEMPVRRGMSHTERDILNITSAHVLCSAFYRRKGQWYTDRRLESLHMAVKTLERFERPELFSFHDFNNHLQPLREEIDFLDDLPADFAEPVNEIRSCSEMMILALMKPLSNSFNSSSVGSYRDDFRIVDASNTSHGPYADHGNSAVADTNSINVFSKFSVGSAISDLNLSG